MLARPFGSGCPPGSFRDVSSAISKLTCLAFRSLGCLEKLTASVSVLSWSPVSTLFLQRPCFLLFLKNAGDKLLALCSGTDTSFDQLQCSLYSQKMYSGGMMSAASPLASLFLWPLSLHHKEICGSSSPILCGKMGILLLQEFLELNSAHPAIRHPNLAQSFQVELSSRCAGWLCF